MWYHLPCPSPRCIGLLLLPEGMSRGVDDILGTQEQKASCDTKTCKADENTYTYSVPTKSEGREIIFLGGKMKSLNKDIAETIRNLRYIAVHCRPQPPPPLEVGAALGLGSHTLLKTTVCFASHHVLHISGSWLWQGQPAASQWTEVASLTKGMLLHCGLEDTYNP